ncbi:MAG: sterol desaturase family protein [Cyclobacteriaceae bacterium]|nr:sterol desaturase family protein [Cyclobacteriaceae bacterium]
MNYLKLLIDGFIGTANWVVQLITFQVPWYQNYFYGLIVISLMVWMLELFFPWRKKQSAFRKDFWLDGFYMFFNFFIFSIAITGFYSVIENIASGFGITMSSISVINLEKLPIWGALVIFFLINDFVQWFTHVLLHRFEFLWRFHKVHHSVIEMGFAAHLRYHWMENIFYKPLKTLVVMLIGGFEPDQAFIVHFITILIGHLNHANVRITWGPLKYVFNNPVMHLWHHVKALPKGQMPGVNFGISLSLWDYIFKTNYIADTQHGEIELGFDDVDEFPKNFWDQILYGFKK